MQVSAYAPKEIRALKEEHVADETAAPVIRRIHKHGTPDPLHGRFEATIGGKRCIVEYEPDTDLRDSEQVPLQEHGGIEAFIRREVLPHAKDAWVDERKTQVGYEISFNRYFYKPQPLRSLDEIKKDILALEHETEGLLKEIVGARYDRRARAISSHEGLRPTVARFHTESLGYPAREVSISMHRHSFGDGSKKILTPPSERGVVPRSSATVTMFKAEIIRGLQALLARRLSG